MSFDLPSGVLAILWDAALRSGAEEVVVGGVTHRGRRRRRPARTALCVAARGMHISKCGAAVAGLALAAAGTLRHVRGNDSSELPSPRHALRAAVVRASLSRGAAQWRTGSEGSASCRSTWSARRTAARLEKGPGRPPEIPGRESPLGHQAPLAGRPRAALRPPPPRGQLERRRQRQEQRRWRRRR